MNCCPTCNQPVEPKEIFVDLISNLVAVGGKTTKLTPRATELLAILAGRMPNFCDSEYIRGKLMGDFGPETSHNMPTVHMCLLRKQIKDMPLQIETRWGKGWRLSVTA